MSLFLANLIVGLLTLALGAHFLFGNATSEKIARAFPRNKSAAYVLIAISAAWFLLHVSQLGEADFGNHKDKLLIVFGVGALLSFIYVPDFLAVRGLAGLGLLAAFVFLDAAYMQWDFPQRRYMAGVVYVGIALAIYLGGMPYKMRDWLDWIYTSKSRTRGIGAFICVVGLSLTATAFTY